MKKAIRKLDALVFIDTNIFLDFYRVRGWEGGLSVLDHISDSAGRIITGSQIEMEYKKNRQKVILDSLGKTKNPDWGALSVPTFLQDSRPNRAIASAKKSVETQVRRMRTRIERVLKNPSAHDPVYRVAQSLFQQDSAFNLSRDKDARYNVRRLALKRFMLGYPPRKDSDTSIGDAINWEWIIRCAAESGKHVILVSRDSDYGHQFQSSPILNDWLRQEFADRVGRRRKLLLTDRLTEAFKLIDVSVTEREEAEEEALLKQAKPARSRALFSATALRQLTENERQVFYLALGLDGQRAHDPDETAALIGLSREETVSLFHEAARKMGLNLDKL